MARRNSRFVNQKVIIGNKSIQAEDLTDSARDTLSVDSDFVKDVIFKLDSDFVNLGFGLDGASIRDSSITQDKFADEVVAALLSGLDSGQTVSLIYPGGEIYQSTAYTPNTDTNTYSPGEGTNGAFIYVQSGTGGGGTGHASRGYNGGGGGGAAGAYYKVTRAELDTINKVQVGARGNVVVGNNGGNGNAGGASLVGDSNGNFITANGGGGGGWGFNFQGSGGAGGSMSANNIGVELISFNGNAGLNGSNRSGGNTFRPTLTAMDVGSGCGLFRIAVFNDAAAQEIVNRTDTIPAGTGGTGGYLGTGGVGQDGSIIIFEFN